MLEEREGNGKRERRGFDKEKEGRRRWGDKEDNGNDGVYNSFISLNDTEDASIVIMLLIVIMIIIIINNSISSSYITNTSMLTLTVIIATIIMTVLKYTRISRECRRTLHGPLALPLAQRGRGGEPPFLPPPFSQIHYYLV